MVNGTAHGGLNGNHHQSWRAWGAVVIVLGVAILLSGACQRTARPPDGVDGTQSAATPAPTAIASPVSGTAVADATVPAPHASPTATLAPTNTPMAMETPVPQPTATPTPVITALARALRFEDLPLVPDLDLFDFARRVGRPVQVLDSPRRPRQDVGDAESFWALDLSNDSVFPVKAHLRASTAHADLYVDDGISITQALIDRAAQVYEESIYPTIIAGFRPKDLGPDSVPLSLLHLRLPAAAGYFDSTDDYPTAIYPFSNLRRMLYLSAEYAEPGSASYIGLVAHELQHAVHWEADRTEEGWVSEGLSVLANLLFDDGERFLLAYQADPRNQLNAWTPVIGTSADYGAAGLFMLYLSLHYPDATGTLRGLVARQEDGFEGVSAYLSAEGYATTWQELIAEWGAANYLDGRSNWDAYPDRQIKLLSTQTLRDVGVIRETRATQAAPYYVELTLPKGTDHQVTFQGTTRTALFPKGADTPPSFWWSGGQDSGDAILSRVFDLRGVETAELSLDLWHDVEAQWDFLYVLASGDGGKSWNFLETRDTVPADQNPIGQAFGPALTGTSGGGFRAEWITEVVNLDAYVGGEVIVRLEYVTDGAINLRGVALGGSTLLAIGHEWSAGPIEGDGGWEARGFFYSDGFAVQTFEVRLLLVHSDGSAEIIPVVLDESLMGSIAVVGTNADYREATLLVMPLAPATREPASFNVTVGTSR